MGLLPIATVTVITTAHNSAATLRLVGLALARQTVRPLEWIIADDGSDASVREMLETLAPGLPFPTVHVWQPHAGFRAARSRNNAAYRSRGEILAFLDQDTVPAADWLAVHLNELGAREVSLGEMVPLAEEEARGMAEALTSGGEWDRRCTPAHRARLGRLHRKAALYAWLRRLGLGLKAKPRLRSCNFALGRSLFFAVNGFDEAYVGWGQEDDDLGRRLYAFGARPLIRIASARVFHFPHPPRHPSAWKAGPNVARYQSGTPPTVCRRGLSDHPHPDVQVTRMGSSV